jgi:hypothetical protein
MVLGTTVSSIGMWIAAYDSLYAMLICLFAYLLIAYCLSVRGLSLPIHLPMHGTVKKPIQQKLP